MFLGLQAQSGKATGTFHQEIGRPRKLRAKSILQQVTQ
jgi:hypothetical protein